MKIEAMKNRVDRASENFAEMRDRTSDTQLKELLGTVLDALEDVGDRLDELELGQENHQYESSTIAISRESGGFTAEVNGTPTGDTYLSHKEAIDGAEGYAQSLQ